MQNWKFWCETFLSPFLLREQLSVVNFKWSKHNSKVLHWFFTFCHFSNVQKGVWYLWTCPLINLICFYKAKLSLCYTTSTIQELKNDFQEAIANLEQNITNSINLVKTELKKEINNLKDVIIKWLQDENVILRDRCSKLEQKLVEFEYYTNNLEQ